MKFFLIFLIQALVMSSLYGEEVKAPEKEHEKIAEPAENSDAYKRIDYSIDWKYKAGEYFIYDCKRQYYACVDLDGYERCVEDRKNSISKDKPKYDCAPLKQFPDKRSCIVYNYSIIERVATKKFCYPK
jgi:hypothetical protein